MEEREKGKNRRRKTERVGRERRNNKEGNDVEKEEDVKVKSRTRKKTHIAGESEEARKNIRYCIK